ncbi:carboxylesterase/lipase family protein [Domibacillus indicus]|uniref:carboxylesterase/lipase family protein n=1 Tax=Domibacillus indicus TaxID=1437523 RepID=UPI0006181800|nr:carboxylesterase/lipase family protein [Domibacillus indicus]
MENILVQTQQGLIKGLEERNARVWKGIPFAQKPTGDLRFQPPAPPEKWEGVLEAFEYGPVCPQNADAAAMLGTPAARMSEDCLYLNVWAPLEAKRRLPVMVWIHGGAFRSGSGSSPLYNGANLAANGSMIVVTINYRLGAFGFLHLAGLDSSYTANVGLLDQIAALKWVQENIEAFGGDPDQVTIFGESAGAMSIASLLAMPAARELCKRAILESGAAQVIPPQQAEMTARAMLHELGVEAGGLRSLQEVPAEAVIQAAEKVTRLYGAGGSMIFQPVIDPHTLPEHPAKAISMGAAKGVDMLIGTNHDEGSFFFRPGTPPMAQHIRDEAMTRLIGREMAEKVKGHYPATTDGQAEFMTDFVFWKPAIEYAETQSRHGSVWMYRFDWHLPDHPHVSRAAHGLEIPFVFSNLAFFERLNIQADEEIGQLARQMQEAWIAFAQTGNPNSPALPDHWPAYDPADRSTFIFSRNSHVLKNPYEEKRQLIMSGSRL